MIRLDGVSKVYRTRYGRRAVLDNVSATFEAGYNFGILGVNGAGKSTLIRLLAGSEEPDRGTVHRSARVSFPLGFGGTFHGALSGSENVAFIARIYGARIRPTSNMSRHSQSWTNISQCRSILIRPGCGHGSPSRPVWRSISTSI